MAAGLTDLAQSRRVIRTLQNELAAGTQTMDIDGVSLTYRLMGGQGEPLLLIHGFLGSSDDFRLIQPALAGQYQVCAIDLIGFGLSDKDPNLDYSKKNMARLADRLMQALGYGQYHVLGHSMGGEVALNLAYEYPGHISSLILLDSAGAADLQRGMASSLPPFLIDLVFKNYLVQRLYYPAAVFNRAAASATNFERAFFFSKQIPAATLNKLVIDNDSGRLAGNLGQISQPALLIWGRQDRIIPLEQGQLLDELLPDSSLLVLEDCGHLAALEKPAELTSAIRDFLAHTSD